ncbi:MAG: bifunctional precorrin-2 dehydrogenase/sirohydrochlorin ferrochelatase [Proteobacteria bacterium]|nr:bifunctional precorrin-2 dehydrogenase/sirohydrochlorin ferrochelatase [Desulfobacteraceae bacterium]MBU3981490.1 bifunctional precorrin-2 dehydrogenase/sirohydrochlorin ferrochelatase [Pseudomonadota bacterium]MBU4013477.1 bifunctional precorrin-2 dehydrogenase/sirohydrochlorin ferrochelatase [Pseudomonadota bacterium]MBU4067042.1 bifunctional precorrin-2 dehydrogenase/sirohydrochlorin ferrochelatase [Pseudomonadota bacterium]MBU4101036.1 bifunctional precorrin-2 dehydrogenase/sirohydrochlo
MRYYPVSLDIQNRKCLVVGGGSVGARKVMTLLECGAIVTVVSPDVAEELLELAEKKMIELKKRPYKPSDIDGIFLVIGATDNEKLNWQINKDAERQNKLCNIADRPEACNFILPSIVNRGNLVIAISTSGKSPAFAKKMRQDLEKEFGEEYDEFLQLMGAIRKKALSEKHEPEAHKQLFEQLINRGLIDMIRDHDEERINSLLLEIFGEGYRFEELMKADS